MTLIKSSTEVEIKNTIKMMVYGQAGMGKTTFALSAPRPLLLDFDGGVNRVNNAHLLHVGIVQIKDWKQALAVLQEDLSNFSTIVVDTIGKMMDYVIQHKCGFKVPRIQDWSGINAEFSSFTRKLDSLGKHIVFVAHRDTRRDGDDTVFIPALREKSYNAIVTELDLLGYMEVRERQWTITFDPTSRNDGKNTCNLPSVMNIPIILDQNGNPVRNNTALQDMVINPYLARIQAKQDMNKKYNEVIAELKENIALITDELSAKDFADRIDKFAHVGNSLAVARDMFSRKLTELKLKYNKETKEYERID